MSAIDIQGAGNALADKEFEVSDGFVSAAHGDAEIDRIPQAAARAVAVVAQLRCRGGEDGPGDGVRGSTRRTA